MWLRLTSLPHKYVYNSHTTGYWTSRKVMQNNQVSHGMQQIYRKQIYIYICLYLGLQTVIYKSKNFVAQSTTSQRLFVISVDNWRLKNTRLLFRHVDRQVVALALALALLSLLPLTAPARLLRCTVGWWLFRKALCVLHTIVGNNYSQVL